MDALHSDVLNCLSTFFTLRHIYTLRQCCRRFRALGKQWITERDEAARQRFLIATSQEVERWKQNSLLDIIGKVTVIAFREEQYSLTWNDLVKLYPCLASFCAKQSCYPDTILNYRCRWNEIRSLFDLDIPYNQRFHDFLMSQTHDDWHVISFLCFRLTKHKYTRAAHYHALRIYEEQVSICDNVYMENYRPGKFDILVQFGHQFRQHFPDFYYNGLRQLALSQRHWAALLVHDVRYKVEPTGYFKTQQEVIDYYSHHITSRRTRDWVERKLQAYWGKVVFRW